MKEDSRVRFGRPALLLTFSCWCCSSSLSFSASLLLDLGDAMSSLFDFLCLVLLNLALVLDLRPSECERCDDLLLLPLDLLLVFGVGGSSSVGFSAEEVDILRLDPFRD